MLLAWYFVADNVLDEVTFGWPRQRGGLQLKEHLALNHQRAFNSVGLNGISLDKDLHSLSAGYKWRLALAIQLAQVPDFLILDEPLAGLVNFQISLPSNFIVASATAKSDWKARADVVKLLKHLKKELTILVLMELFGLFFRELEDLVDLSWRMEMGGVLRVERLLV
ncbi:hypothetical protein CRYUN_Cryun24cG0124800 [Craigia yunnanensis]